MRSISGPPRAGRSWRISSPRPGHGGIVLTNAAGQDWLGYRELARHRPDLIHLQIRGRRDNTAAVDYTVNAATGFPLITGPEEHAGPVNHVLPAWDVACGLYAALGLLAAERHRRRTGEGRAITLALEDAALAVAGHLGFLAEAQLGMERPPIGNYLYGAFARDFATADGARILLVPQTARHFADLAEVTGLAGTFAELERLLGADFSADGDRYAHREVIASVLGPRVRREPAAAGDRPAGGGKCALAPGSPLAQPGVGAVQPAPVLGADTVDVLTTLLGLPAEAAARVAGPGEPPEHRDQQPAAARDYLTSESGPIKRS